MKREQRALKNGNVVSASKIGQTNHNIVLDIIQLLVDASTFQSEEQDEGILQINLLFDHPNMTMMLGMHTKEEEKIPIPSETEQVEIINIY